MPPSQFTVPDDLTLTSNAQNLLALKGTATPPAAIVFAPPSAVADASLSASTIAPSIDETNNALRIRAEYSNGTTLKTAIIPFQPASTITVGASGADFTSIQGAWDSLKGRLLQSAVTIAVQSGTYSESVSLNLQPFSGLITIQGDTRTAAGQHVATTGSITKSGSNCTITLTSTPPSDFTSSDFVVVGGAASAANVGRFAIVSIDTVNKTVTYTNAAGVAEAVRPDTQLTFCPDRIINSTGLGSGVTCTVDAAPLFTGFTVLSTTTGIVGIVATGRGTLTVNKCVVFGVDLTAFQASDGGYLKTDAKCVAVKCTNGFICTRNAYLLCDGTYVSDSGTAAYTVGAASLLNVNNAVATKSVVGFYSTDTATLYAINSISSYNTDSGFLAGNTSYLAAAGATARNNGTGYNANWAGFINAVTTSGNNSGNTTNYSPSTSGVPGNNNAMVRWS